jgi:superoxide dismutase, Cu-Zn family
MRRTASSAVALALASLLAACAGTPRVTAPAATPPPPPRAVAGTARQAVANLASASGTLVSGRVTLRAADGGVRLSGVVGGLRPHAAHALQVHARGDCSAVDASSAGPWFDATGAGGVEGSRERIVADADGVANVNVGVPGAVLGGGAANDIGGRALVVLGSTAGATGARVACGVITPEA